MYDTLKFVYDISSRPYCRSVQDKPPLYRLSESGQARHLIMLPRLGYVRLGNGELSLGHMSCVNLNFLFIGRWWFFSSSSSSEVFFCLTKLETETSTTCVLQRKKEKKTHVQHCTKKRSATGFSWKANNSKSYPRHLFVYFQSFSNKNSNFQIIKGSVIHLV